MLSLIKRMNKTVAFYVLEFLLVVTFMYFFGTGVRKLIKHEIGTKITIDKGKPILPSFNICPLTHTLGPGQL